MNKCNKNKFLLNWLAVVFLLPAMMTAKADNVKVTDGTTLKVESAGVLTVTGTLTVDAGGTLTADGLLLLEGSTFTNNGTQALGSGEIRFDGTGAQTIGGSTGSAFPDLTVNNTAGVTLTGTALSYSVTGDLTIGSGAFLTVNPTVGLTVAGTTDIASAQSLRIKADESGLGSFIDGGFSGAGSASVEQWVYQNEWHLVSAPISSATIATYMNMYLIAFDESDGSWDYLTEPTTTPLAVSKGYAVWPSDGLTGTATVTFTGSLNTGDKPISLAYTETSSEKGWNLLGNPYPSSIDWNGNAGWALTNVDASMYLYDHAAGNYKSWNYNTQVGTNGKTDGYIPPTQGFWVKASSTGASLTIPNAQRLHSAQAFYKAGAEHENLLRLKVAGENASDETVIAFNPDATGSFDGAFDAYHIQSLAENALEFHSTLGGVNYAVNWLPSTESNSTVDVTFSPSEAGIFTITATGAESFVTGEPLWLEDRATNTFQNLRNNSEYTFAADASQNANRFRIHFKDATGIAENNNNGINIFAAGKTINIDLVENTRAQFMVYDVMGKPIAAGNGQQGRNTINVNAPTGIYIVKVVTAAGVVSQKVYLQ
jgi:hypothetical protein